MAGLDAGRVVVVGYSLGRPNFGAASRLQADKAVHMRNDVNDSPHATISEC